MVLGDSHTEGVVHNEESFASVLEGLLQDTPGWEESEVLNAGVGTTGPRGYLGQLRRNGRQPREHGVDLDPERLVSQVTQRVPVEQSGEGLEVGGDRLVQFLRHTHASAAAGEGLSLPLVGKLLGHKRASTTERYAHLADDPVRKAADLVQGRLAEHLGAGARRGHFSRALAHALGSRQTVRRVKYRQPALPGVGDRHGKPAWADIRRPATQDGNP